VAASSGFPIAKVAAKLAVGYTLDELMNDITGGRTPASFEPSIDYVVTKIPRFNFEKFAGANDRLTTQMKSVGEVMAIGRTQQESLQKALRGLEVGATGFDPKVSLDDPEALTKIRRELKDAGAERIWYIADAFRAGLSVDGVFNLTNIDRWFLVQIEELVRLEEKVAELGINGLDADFLRMLKRKGFADARLAKLAGVREAEIRKLRDQYDLHPVYKRVDTCAAEFSTDTACMVRVSVSRGSIKRSGSGIGTWKIKIWSSVSGVSGMRWRVWISVASSVFSVVLTPVTRLKKLRMDTALVVSSAPWSITFSTSASPITLAVIWIPPVPQP
jgi:hypothetical protein